MQADKKKFYSTLLIPSFIFFCALSYIEESSLTEPQNKIFAERLKIRFPFHKEKK